MSEVKELVAVPAKETALSVFTAKEGLEPWLQQIRAKVDEFNATLPELTTLKGRKLYSSMAYQIAQTKNALEEVGKKLSAEQKEVPKLIDAERKRVWDKLELWQKEVRKPLDDWQEAEARRIDLIKANIEMISDLAMHLDGVTSEDMEDRIQRVEAVAIADKWAEFQVDAALAKEKALTALYTALTNRKVYEADQAELAQRRADDEARAQRERDAEIARVAAEQARIEVEQRAQAERDAAARREQELLDQAAAAQRATEQAAREAEALAERQRLQLQLQAEQSERQAAQAKADQLAAEQRAEQDRIAAEQRQAAAVEQARQDELDRQAAAVAFELQQAQAREADLEHKKSINRTALEAFIAGGMPEACAKQAVTLIAQRKIPAIAITY